MPDEATTHDAAAGASSWVDVKNRMFWTWTSPKDIEQSCADHMQDVGGVMVGVSIRMRMELPVDHIWTLSLVVWEARRLGVTRRPLRPHLIRLRLMLERIPTPALLLPVLRGIRQCLECL
jgi:hypothetical protein